MEYYGKDIAVSVHDLAREDDGEAVISTGNLRLLAMRNRVTVLRRGGRGNTALVSYASLPEKYRERFEAKYGKPEDILGGRNQELRHDSSARAFYSSYRLPDGSFLPADKIDEYTLSAEVLRALQDMVDTQKAMRRACNNNTPVIWEAVHKESERLRDAYGHTLPRSEARLRDKMRQFAREGYECLVSGKLGNANSLKITGEAARWIIAHRRSMTPVYSTQELLEGYNAEAARRGWKPLRSKTSLLEFLDRPEVKPQWYDAVYGELAAKQLYSRHHKTERPSMRDSLWYGDGTKLNLFYKAYEGGKTVVRTAMVYEVADAFNDTLLGYDIAQSESFDSQYRAFRMAVELSGHKPYEIVTDNQGGQTSKIAKTFFAGICRVARTTAPYNPQSKTIERLFGSFQSQVLARDWRFTGQNISSKEGWKTNREFLEANKESLYTFGELCAAYAEARRQWNSMRMGATTRLEAYHASVNPSTEAVTAADMADMFWVWTDRPCRFTADGITVTYRKEKRSYEVLTADGRPDMEWRSRNTGREFLVRLDPLDTSLVMLYEQTPLGPKYSATARPYIRVHRNIQEQGEGEAAFIRWSDTQNKRERVRRAIAAKELETEHGTAPEQHGLVTPALRGISESEFERLAEGCPVVIPTPEPDTIGGFTKAVSNADYDPLAALNRI